MDILSVRSYKGRNIYSHRPVIKAVIDVGSMYDTPTKAIRSFNESLISILPGLKKHYCSLGYEGGFAQRLIEGTYIPHVLEHIVLELQCIAGYEVYYGKSREYSNNSVYYIIFEYKNEKLALECLLVAVDIIKSLIVGMKPKMEGIFQHLKNIAAQTDMGPSTRALFEEAKRREIPVTCIDNSSLLKLGNGKYTRYLEASLTDRPSCINVDLAGNKQLTKEILAREGMPVPIGEIAYTQRAAIAAAKMIGYPVVIKPFDSNQGKGVFTNISNEQELLKAFNTASVFSRALIVEKHISGADYRLLIVGGRMVAASERMPPDIVGDGIHTIRQLVDIENENPLRGFDHERPLTKIKLDSMSLQVLKKEGYDESTVLSKGMRVLLRYNGNISTGGTARDCTEEVHEENAQLAIRAAEALGLDVAGIDITCDDISVPLTDDNGAIIEVNAAPGLRMHLHPTQGKPRNVAGDILEYMFPDSALSNIPIVSITGTNGKTTVSRMIAHVLKLAGKAVGMASSSGIYIDGECIYEGDNTGALSAETLLGDKRVEACVLETARGGIIKRGLGYDLADVGVVVNVSDDHIGCDGTDTLEELVNVKSLVVEAVKKEGVAVLNADDAMTPFFLEKISCKPLLFSANSTNQLILRHIDAGFDCLYLKEESIVKAGEGGEAIIASIDEIPITFGGRSRCNIENSLAAAAALIGLGVNIETIREGMASFMADTSTNPGRFNTFSIGEVTVMIDYGHNPAGYKAVIDTIKSFNASSFTGVIGVPGDRRDQTIHEVGSICGRFFSKLYIKEDNDLRGRNAGEVADILYNAAIGEGADKDSVTVIYSETKAFETAITEAKPGELVVLFYEELEPALEVVEKFMNIKEEGEKSLQAAKLDEKAAG